MAQISTKKNFFSLQKPQSNISHTQDVSIPWIEKYRPKTISDIASHDDIVLFFKKVLETNELPNLMLYGPPGTGKTSSVMALARDLFGSDQLKSRVLELNASDERGIQVIREKVKSFAQLTVSNTTHKLTLNNLPCFKLVILDEADNMTSSAQAALRRIMESTISNTRFCLICNYITKIIDPILSRCTSLYFKPLLPEQCLSRLVYIRDLESLKISDENLALIVKHSDGDLRKSVMYLQSCRYYNFDTINKNLVFEICGVISDVFFSQICRTLHQGSFEDIVQLSQDFVSDGFSVTKLLNQLLEHVLTTKSIQETQRAEILSKLSGVDLMITDGADEYLQVLSVFSHVFYTLHQPV